MAVSQKLEFAELDDLFLDPLNPRLGRHHTGRDMKQPEVLALIETWKIDELAVSFLESGQFWTQEAMVCVQEKLYGKDRLVVVEGNRRLAALMCLRDTYEGRRNDRMWKEIIAGKKPPKDLFTKIPYLLADDRKSVEAYLGFRHVKGNKQWHPSQKAEFMARLVDTGLSYQEVGRRVGVKTMTVRHNYVSHQVMSQIEKLCSPSTTDFENGFCMLFLALRSAAVQEFMQIDVMRPPARMKRPVPNNRVKALKSFAAWIFGSAERPPLFTDSRRIVDLDRILQSQHAVAYLQSKAFPSMDMALRIATNDDREIIQSVENAATCVELALAHVERCRKSQRLKTALGRLADGVSQFRASCHKETVIRE
jgi:hypothetical protein